MELVVMLQIWYHPGAGGLFGILMQWSLISAGVDSHAKD